MRHLRLAIRTLLKTPFVSIVAIVSLALGIGANAAIFSLFNQVLLRELPVREPGELVNLAAPGPKPGSQSCNQAGECSEVFTYPMFRDLERVQNVFTGIAAHRLFGANFAYNTETLNGEGMFVSGSYFPLLGIQPTTGRLLGPRDDAGIGQSPVAVLEYEYWRDHLAGNPDVVGKSIVVNGHALTIVGVAPRGFRGTTFGGDPKVFVPITMRAALDPQRLEAFNNRRDYWIYLFARLRPGVSLEQARLRLNRQYHAIVNDVEAPLQKGMSDQTMKRFRAREIPMERGARGQSGVYKNAQTPLRLLLAVTGLVLLIACANIANLLLARGATRSGELAVRLAIGAGRRHLVSQLLTESFVLAVLGGVAGLFVAGWTLRLIGSLMPPEAAAVVQLSLDGTALVFTAALAIATGFLFGLFPALHTTRPDLASTLKGQAGQPGGARSTRRFRTTLATAQIALSMMLLAAAGLFTKSLVKVNAIDLGLDLDNVITFRVSPQLNGYSDERSAQFFAALNDAVSALPGVRGVTAAAVPLLAGSNWANDVSVEGFHADPDTDTNSHVNSVGTAFFRTTGMRLLSGREFTQADAANAPKVAVVNEEFARKFNLGRNVVGRRMSMNRTNKLDIEIVGLVQNAKYSEVRDKFPPQYFIPYTQDKNVGQLTFYVRSSLPPEQVMPDIRRAVRRLDPNLPLEGAMPMPEQVRNNLFLDRFVTTLSGAFALLATLLAAIGLYGVLAYTVAQRTREIGLRMALGAEPGRVRRMVMTQVGWMTLAGGAVGMLGAIYIGRKAESLLFEMQGRDPMVLGGAVVLLAFVSFVAGAVPAYRASRIDPMLALRYE